MKALSLGILLCWIFCQPLSGEDLRVGFFHLPPHCYSEGGEAKGSAVEYFRLVAKEMQVTPIFREYPLTRVLITLERDELDVVLFVAKTPERSARFIFPRRNYAEVRSGILVARNSPVTEITDVETLKKLQIGTTQDGFLTPMMMVPGLRLTSIANQNALELNLMKLLAGRLDGVYQPDTAIFYYLSEDLGVESDVRVLELPEAPTPIYSVFSRTSALRYQERYEEALERLKGKLNYDAVLEAYRNRRG